MSYMTGKQAWIYLDEMQKRIMSTDSQITESEFFTRPLSECVEYYNWMRKQDNSWMCPPCWDGLSK